MVINTIKANKKKAKYHSQLKRVYVLLIWIILHFEFRTFVLFTALEIFEFIIETDKYLS